MDGCMIVWGEQRNESGIDFAEECWITKIRRRNMAKAVILFFISVRFLFDAFGFACVFLSRTAFGFIFVF